MKSIKSLFSKKGKTKDTHVENAKQEPLEQGAGDGNKVYQKVQEIPMYGNLIDLEAKEIAKFLTKKDWEDFKMIRKQDLLGYMSPDFYQTSELIQKMKHGYFEIYFWILDTVLSGETAKQRAGTITKFIKLAKALMKHNNLHAAHAVLIALQNPAIERLNKTWKKITSHKKELLREMFKVFAVYKNYERLNMYMQKLMDKKTVFIPYIGLFLYDFRQMESPNTEIKAPTIGRSAIMIWIMGILQDANYEKSSISEEMKHYWDSLFKTMEEMNALKAQAMIRSQQLEKPKHLVYKVLDVSAIDLTNFE